MKLNVKKREILGKKVKNLRKEGLVPVVVYGKSLAEPLHLSCDRVEFIKFYKKYGTSTPLTLSGDGVDQMVLVYELQLDPVTDILMHIDFIAIKKWEKVTTDVHVVLTGEAPVESEGDWQVQLLRDTLEIEAIPSKLPKEITVDISKISEPSETIHLSDIKMPEGVELLDDADQALITVVRLGEEEEEPEQEVDAAGMPIDGKEAATESSDEDTEKTEE